MYTSHIYYRHHIISNTILTLKIQSACAYLKIRDDSVNLE